MRLHLFNITSNQSGSTLIRHAFAACENVAHMGRDYCFDDPNEYVIREGMDLVNREDAPFIPHQKKEFTWSEILSSLEDENNYNWKSIANTWNELWSKSKCYKQKDCVILESSPSHLARIKMLEKHFPDSYFVLQVRNPYAVAEGIQRRVSKRESCSFSRAALHAIRVLVLSKRALEKSSNLICWRYEDLIDKRLIIENLIKETIPHIEDFKLNIPLPSNSLEGYATRDITNFNEKQISRLTSENLAEINEVFDNYSDIMMMFGYRRIK